MAWCTGFDNPRPAYARAAAAPTFSARSFRHWFREIPVATHLTDAVRHRATNAAVARDNLLFFIFYFLFFN
jgi:hypothetical protein